MSDLIAMDHGAAFAAAVDDRRRVGDPGVADRLLVCHKSPGSTWADGHFHASIGTAAPKDCLHLPLPVDGRCDSRGSHERRRLRHEAPVGADHVPDLRDLPLGRARQGGGYQRRGSGLVSRARFTQACRLNLAACVDCHAVSEPAANAPTSSTVSYALALGATAGNTAQWMNHGSIYVAGRTAPRATPATRRAPARTGRRPTSFHAQVSGVTACNACHGVANGGGGTAGTNNNLPVGLTNSTAITSAAKDATTGDRGRDVRSDQPRRRQRHLATTAASATPRPAPRRAPGIQGHEWAQAKFHQTFNAANALVANGTTGRCSNCHLNVKPAASFPGQDHTRVHRRFRIDDCGSCHSWPGAGGVAAPDWLGASGGVPTVISVGGFTISNPPAANTTTTSRKASPTCRTRPSGRRPAPPATSARQAGAMRSDTTTRRRSTTPIATLATRRAAISSTPCGTARPVEASGAGDTRPFTISSLSAKKGGNSCTVTFANHFYPADCSQCHTEPAGTVNTKTGTAYTTSWTFNHSESKMKGLCNDCHGPCPGD